MSGAGHLEVPATAESDWCRLRQYRIYVLRNMVLIP